MSTATQPEQTDDAPARASERAFVVATLFLIFEAATVLLLGWAVVFQRLALFGLVEAVVFVAFLALGYAYARRRGAFDGD